MAGSNDREIEARIQQHLSDGELEQAARQVRGHYRIDGYLLTVLPDLDEAWEALGVFFEDLWRGPPSLRGKSSFRTWVFRLALLAARQQLRSRDAPGWSQVPRGELATVLVDEIRSQTIICPGPKGDRFAGVVAALDLSDETLVFLRVDRGLSWQEIAEVMSDPGHEVDAATMRKRYELLKDKLRRLAREHGLRRERGD